MVAHGLHLVRFTQLRLELVALRLSLFAPREVAREHGGGLACRVALERDAHLDRELLAACGARRHLAEHGLRRELRERQRLRGAG